MSGTICELFCNKPFIFNSLNAGKLAWKLLLPVLRDRGSAAATPLTRGDVVAATGKIAMRSTLGVAAILVLFIGLTGAPVVKGQTAGVAGKYQCTQVKVRGKVKSCSSAQLNLKSDGRFERRGWEGDYSVSASYIELSDKTVKSKAKLEPGYKLIFKYQGKEGAVEVIYERRQSAPANETLG